MYKLTKPIFIRGREQLQKWKSMMVLLNSDIPIISVHLKEVTQSENTGGYRLAWSRIPSQH